MQVDQNESDLQDDIPPPTDAPPEVIAQEDAPKPKKTKASAYRIITDIISGVNQLMPEFDENLLVVQSALGKREALREFDGIVELVPIEYVATLILRYTQTKL